MHKALFWEKEGQSVRCRLCPHQCLIPNGSSGICRVRHNHEGELYSLSWGIVPALALDPVEKKPFARFYPGSFILSAGFYGCNMRCLFCQNWSISQSGPPSPDGDPWSGAGDILSPQALVRTALDMKKHGNIGIAFTYSEPLVSIEYILEAAPLARKEGLRIAVVTNGYINAESLSVLLPHVDAFNIDLKAFTESFYRDLCGASLSPVLQTITAAHRRAHVELTTLVIPGHNDSEDEIDALASWIASLSADIPLHLNRHHPDYRMTDVPPVELDRLASLARTARTHLSCVHTGNIN